MDTQRREKIDTIDTRAIDFFLGCGNGASLGNLLARFPLFPLASPLF